MRLTYQGASGGHYVCPCWGCRHMPLCLDSVYPELRIPALISPHACVTGTLLPSLLPGYRILLSCTQGLFESLLLLILPPLESGSHLFPGSFIYSTDIYCIQWGARLCPECGASSKEPQGPPFLSLLQSLFRATRRGSWVMNPDLWCGRTLHRGSSGPSRDASTGLNSDFTQQRK